MDHRKRSLRNLRRVIAQRKKDLETKSTTIRSTNDASNSQTTETKKRSELRRSPRRPSSVNASKVLPSQAKQDEAEKDNHILADIEESSHDVVEALMESSEPSDEEVEIPAKTKRSISEQSTKRQRKKLPNGYPVLQEIKKLQRSTEFLIPRIPFAQVCREIFMECGGSELRVAKAAVDCLQESAELYLVQMFEDASVLSIVKE